MAVLEVKGLKKHFGEVRAVNGIDLTSTEGELLVLLGPSGCGKSTLLRMIAGLENPTEGEVVIDGQVVNELPPRARNMALVFQSYALYPHMSVADNIAFPLKARGLDKGDRAEKVQWAASLLGIDGLLSRKPRELSGGERQRVALARALVREPVLFLFDEPLTSLDAKIRTHAREELRQIQKRTQITTVYVTHDQVEAMGLGDRLAVMDQGKVRQLGTPEVLYNEPADAFVATFLGTPPMNLIERGERMVGFRPEHLSPKRARSFQDNFASFSLTITDLEFLGAEWLAYGAMETPSGNTRIIARLSSEEREQVRVGEAQEFIVPHRELRFFDRNTGVRAEPQPL